MMTDFCTCENPMPMSDRVCARCNRAIDGGFESGWYMASTSNIDPKYNETIGIIQTVAQGSSIPTQAHWGMYRARLDSGIPWCLDNGVFTGKFEVNYWRSRIDAFCEYKD